MALDPEILYRKDFGKPFPGPSRKPYKPMTKFTKQLTAIIVLSLLVTIPTLVSYLPTITDRDPVPAAHFNTKIRKVNPARTLRPDGQTEDAQSCNERTFERELSGVCPELDQTPFSVDSIYLSPTVQTARLILKRAFRKLENVYVSQAYDCDDNAQELMVLLRKEALVEYREFPAALAIGFIGVRFDGPIYEYRSMDLDPSEYPFYHAMVVMRLKNGRWLLIEPLSHQVCELTGPIYEGQIVVGLLYF